MSYNINQPGKYDAVLGNEDVNTSVAVLGGIEGVKQRLLAPVVEHRLAALNEAVKYGQQGINLLALALKNNNRLVRVRAYEILETIKAPEAQVALIQYCERHYLIHFNCVYQCKRNQHYKYIRFYPDYTVITTTTKDTPEQLVTWFNKENQDIYNDIYIVESKKQIIRFSSHSKSKIVDCVANIGIYGTTIQLDWLISINNRSGSDEYQCVKLPSTP